MPQQKPVAKFRAGGVSVALWENQINVKGRDGPVTVLKASLERRYCDADGNWKSTTSLSRNEVALGIHCLQQAVRRMIERGNERNEDGSEETVE